MFSIETLETMIRKRRLRWLGQVTRMEHHHIPRQLLVCKFEGGKRSVGGQKLRWVDIVMRDLKKCKINKEWMHIAQHRAKWRSIVDAVVSVLEIKTKSWPDIKFDQSSFCPDFCQI